MEICPSRSGVSHPTPFPLRFLLNGSTTFKKKRRKETETFWEAAAAAAEAACASARTCWPASFYLLESVKQLSLLRYLPARSARAPTEEIKTCWALSMSLPKPTACQSRYLLAVWLKELSFLETGHTLTKQISNPNASPDWMKWQLRLIFTAFYIFLFAFHCVSTAQPAAVQQLQGLHEAQAQLSDCDRQGVHVGGECKLTVKRVHLKPKEVDVQVWKSGSWWSMNPFLC